MNDPTVFRRDCFKLNCATTLFNQRDSALELPVRMGLATGEAELRGVDYFGAVAESRGTG